MSQCGRNLGQVVSWSEGLVHLLQVGDRALRAVLSIRPTPAPTGVNYSPSEELVRKRSSLEMQPRSRIFALHHLGSSPVTLGVSNGDSRPKPARIWLGKVGRLTQFAAGALAPGNAVANTVAGAVVSGDSAQAVSVLYAIFRQPKRPAIQD